MLEVFAMKVIKTTKSHDLRLGCCNVEGSVYFIYPLSIKGLKIR